MNIKNIQFATMKPYIMIIQFAYSYVEIRAALFNISFEHLFIEFYKRHFLKAVNSMMMLQQCKNMLKQAIHW